MLPVNSYTETNLLDMVDLDDVLLTDCAYLDIMECESFCEVADHLTVSHLNVHSIPSKYEDIIDLLDTMKEKKLLPDVLLLCETFFNERNYDKFPFQNFDIISAFRKNKSMGGVSIMIKKQLKYYEREDLKVLDEGKFESIFIEIPRQSQDNIVIGEVYTIAGTNENEFISNYESIVNRIRNEHKKIIIGTDQNLDYLKLHIHNNTMKFFELNHLLPTIFKPTRVTHSSATLQVNHWT
jgi:exonuclease III